MKNEKDAIGVGFPRPLESGRRHGKVTPVVPSRNDHRKLATLHLATLGRTTGDPLKLMAQEDLGKQEARDAPLEIEHLGRRRVHLTDPEVGSCDDDPLGHAFENHREAEFLLLEQRLLPGKRLGCPPKIIAGTPVENRDA